MVFKKFKTANSLLSRDILERVEIEYVTSSI